MAEKILEKNSEKNILEKFSRFFLNKKYWQNKMEINRQFNLKYKIGDLVWVVRNGETPNRNATWVSQCMIVEIICERPTMGRNDKELRFDDVFYGVVLSLGDSKDNVLYYSDTSVFDSLEQMHTYFKEDEGDNLFLFPPEPILKKPI